MKYLRGIVIVLGVCVFLAGGKGVDAEPPVPARSVSAADRIAASPDMAIGPDGSIHLIWVDKGPKPTEAPAAAAARHHTHKTYNDLYYARSNDSGQSFSAPVRINATPGQVWGFATSRPRIAVGKSGIVHLFYHANRFDRSAAQQAVDAVYARSTDGGNTFEAPRTLNSFAAGKDGGELSEAHCFGTMGVAPNGDVHAYWIDTRHMKSDRDNGAVYGIVSRNEGKGFEKERLIFENEACPCCQLNIAFSTDKKVYLTLRSVMADGSRNATVAQSDDGGRIFQPRVAVSAKKWAIDACPLKPLNLSTGANGRVYATWYAGEMDPAGVYFSSSDNIGAHFGNAFPLHPEAKLSDHAQSAVAADGKIHVIWDARVGDTKRIFLRSSADHGKTFSPVQEVSMEAGAADYPVIAPLQKKTAIAYQLNGTIRFQILDEVIAKSGQTGMK